MFEAFSYVPKVAILTLQREAHFPSSPKSEAASLQPLPSGAPAAAAAAAADFLVFLDLTSRHLSRQLDVPSASFPSYPCSVSSQTELSLGFSGFRGPYWLNAGSLALLPAVSFLLPQGWARWQCPCPRYLLAILDPMPSLPQTGLPAGRSSKRWGSVNFDNKARITFILLACVCPLEEARL